MNFYRQRFFHVLAFRLCCCFFSSTWFVPDEYFQSVEVAYHLVYGKGHLSWEWLPEWALRSPLHPLIYAFPFWLLKLFSLDFGFIIRWIPNIIHAFLFAIADICFINWAKSVIGFSLDALYIILPIYFTNWFIIYCSTRTLSNTLECCLMLIALNFYTKEDGNYVETKKKNDDNFEEEKLAKFSIPKIDSFCICLIFVSIAGVIRPTTWLLWIPLCYGHFVFYLLEGLDVINQEIITKRMEKYILSYSPFVIIIPFFTFLLDSFYYGRPTSTFFNFFHFNIIKSGNALFGSHPWHWYFTQGLPSILLFASIPLFTILVKLIRSRYYVDIRLDRRYILCAGLYIFSLSLIAHKEHRFVLPIIPILLPYIAVEINSYKNEFLKKWLINLIIGSNLLSIIYFGLIHQRGPYVANNKIVQYVDEKLQEDNSSTIYVLQLMPCYSMPMYAGLHPYAQNVSITMLDCGINNTTDESEQFHSSPIPWLNKNWFSKKLYLTNLIVCYQHIFYKIESFLMQKGFERHSLIFHTYFTSSSRQHSKIILLSKIEEE
uniref:Mannosyltransferase n=1 Tax=Meloidogyne incognita TaxID=6306 RepID=A0A914KPL9_MELIC